MATWQASLQGKWLAGPFLERAKAKLPEGTRVLDSELWQPMAEFVGVVGLAQYEDRGADDFWSIAPEYLRESAAEEKLKS